MEQGTLPLDDRRGKVALNRLRAGSPRLVDLGTTVCLNHWDREQKAVRVEEHRKQGIHRQGVVGEAHPVVHTEGCRTLEGSPIWT